MELPDGLIDRIRSRIRHADDGCWIYTGPLTNGGYGIVWWWDKGQQKTINYTAHRSMWELANGPIPDGQVIDHLCHDPATCKESPCDHRACCNPAHMRVTSQRENSLRSNGFTAAHAERTHCPQGHEYTPENTYVRTDRKYPGRQCRTCNREQNARRRGYRLRA